MSKRLLLGVIVVLLITNITSLLFWNKDEGIVLDNDKNAKISSKEAVASVGGKEISYQDWISTLRSAHGKQQLKTMIDRSVVKQLAKKGNIKVPDKIIERELALLTSMQGVMTKEELEKKEEMWREDIRYRYQLEELLTKDTSIDEQEIKDYYEIYKNQYDFKATMQLSHILVQNFDTAEKVTLELDDGASFDLLAREYSIDEDSEKNGGYLGFITTASQFFPNGYEKVADNMEEGTYSEPFEADSGVAIIFLHQKLPSVEFTYDEIKPYVKSELALEKLNQSLSANSLWDKLDIEWVFDE